MVKSNKDFVHWHVHSEYSAFDGLAKMTELVQSARTMGFPALALTDHGNIGGWIKFIKECSATKDKNGKTIEASPITPILGCEFYVSRNRHWKDTEHQPDKRRGNRHLNLYASNWKGYQNICSLSEKSWVEGYYHDPRVDIELISQYADGLICGSACLSSVINANLLHGSYDQARKAAGILKDIFDDRFFLEVMYHGIPGEGAIVPDIFRLGKDLNIPVIATNDVHYIKKEHAKSQEVLMCISTSRCLNDPKHISMPYHEFYLKSHEEMAAIFSKTPSALTNSIAMLEKIDFNDINDNLFGGMRLPKFELPEEYSNPFEYLCALAKDGLKRLGWDKSKSHIEALKKELYDVKVAYEHNGYDFSTYFLIVQDCIDFARNKGIIVGAGRGSGYASVLLRCLNISYGPDPLEYDLLWERFLGFDDFKFILDKDFGFGTKRILRQEAVSGEELDTDRDYEDDMGGVDRY
jgi:DNA polymerase III subunit alpha